MLKKLANKNYKNRPKKIINLPDLKKLSNKLKKQNKKIVFTIGSFDLLNPGHCRYLAEVKAKGDILVVGVTTDRSDAGVKGPTYPLMNQDIRAELVSHIKGVDYVTIVDEDQPYAVLILLKPDVFVTTKLQEYVKPVVKIYGGKMIKMERFQPYYGIKDLVNFIADIRITQILEKYIKDRIGDFKLDPLKHLKPADFGEQRPRDSKSYDANSDILNMDGLQSLGERFRKEKKEIVFVSGSYDLLHVGHARFIEQAGLLGDVLVVGIPSDSSLRELKGVGRPVITERSRAYILCHLDSVDKVVIFNEKTVLKALEALKPDVFFTVEEDWNSGYKDSPEYKLVASYKGKVVRAKRQSPFLSASMIIDKAAQQRVHDIFKEFLSVEKYQKILTEHV